MAAERLELEVNGRELSISNPTKVLYPDDGITKAEIIGYYERIAPLVVRHSRDRPVALHRFPDGIGKGGFFQKQKGKHFPEWITTVELDTRDGSTEFVVIEDPATIVYLAGQGVLVL